MTKSRTIYLFKGYDPASAGDYVYGRFAETFQPLPGSAITSGSSTTVTEGVSGNAFAAGIGVGDLLYEPTAGTTLLVTAKASDASITVNTAVNWSTARSLQVMKFQSGSTGTSGWVGIGGASRVQLHIEIATLGSASCTFTLETRLSPGVNSSTILTPSAFTATTVSSTTGTSSFADIPITDSAQAFRLGVKVGTDSTDVVSAVLRIEYAA
jgi:hypothetical protein